MEVSVYLGYVCFLLNCDTVKFPLFSYRNRISEEKKKKLGKAPHGFIILFELRHYLWLGLKCDQSSGREGSLKERERERKREEGREKERKRERGRERDKSQASCSLLLPFLTASLTRCSCRVSFLFLICLFCFHL